MITTKEQLYWLIGLGIGLPIVVATIIKAVGSTAGI